jgi:hypothetical protein
VPPASARPRRNPESPTPRPQIPLRRLLLLVVPTAAFAFALQALLAVTEAPVAGALILLVVPVAAAAVVFFGLRPYPTAGRARLAAMVAVALFLVGLTLG